ncbi:MAG: SRPBCC domain-containing protein [Chloroflexi bacterium]|nr:SRPBCC domain-containing protein [Chloroflexota bacterium]MBP8054587.1 SRPBCC domain-containing protein [Chloroflexota bacterium]
MKELRTEIEIQASPEQVWQILTDLDKYPEWNPFIHHASGKAQVGEKVDITFQSGSKEMTLHCQVLAVTPSKELCWKYHVIHPSLFRGEHHFTIEPMGSNQVRFIDREVFNGLFVPLQAKDIDTHSKLGFEAMDKALKARAEAIN